MITMVAKLSNQLLTFFLFLLILHDKLLLAIDQQKQAKKQERINNWCPLHLIGIKPTPHYSAIEFPLSALNG